MFNTNSGSFSHFNGSFIVQNHKLICGMSNYPTTYALNSYIYKLCKLKTTVLIYLKNVNKCKLALNVLVRGLKFCCGRTV